MLFERVWWLPLFLAVLLAAALLMPLPDVLSADAPAPPPVLVIDAGHGGEDGGAVAADGTLESDINLDVALRLEALAAFWGQETVLTRESAQIAYPPEARTLSAMKRADQAARVALINATPGAVLLSIHQNKYPAASPCGPQVFYAPTGGSDALAALVQANLTAELAPANRRLAVPIDESIYLMKSVSCTAVLVECGFLSNPEELSRLESESYRLELAAVLLGSWLQYIRGNTS